MSASRMAVLRIVLLAAFATNLTLTILTIAIAPIAADFDVSVSAASWVTVLPIVVTALVTPAAGRASDRFGRRRLWLAGYALSIVGICISGVAPNLTVLILARVLTGVGTAAVMPSGLAIAVAAWPKAEYSTPIGWWTSTVALAPTVGVLVGGAVVDYLSWRWLFAAQVPPSLLAWGLAYVAFPKDEAPGEKLPFDWAGSFTAALAVLGLLLAFQGASDWGLLDVKTLGSVVCALVFGALFVYVERRAVAPVLPPAIFQQRVTRRAIAVRSIVQSVYMGSFIILPIWMMRVSDWRPAAVAIALAPRPLAMTLMGPVAGRLSTRFGARGPAAAGTVLIGTAATILGLLTVDTHYLIMLAALLCQGAGLALVSTSTTAAVTSASADDDLGATSGVVGVTTSLANALGMSGLLGVVAIAGGETSAVAYKVAFFSAAAIALSTLFVPIRDARPRSA